MRYQKLIQGLFLCLGVGLVLLLAGLLADLSISVMHRRSLTRRADELEERRKEVERRMLSMGPGQDEAERQASREARRLWDELMEVEGERSQAERTWEARALRMLGW